MNAEWRAKAVGVATINLVDQIALQVFAVDDGDFRHELHKSVTLRSLPAGPEGRGVRTPVQFRMASAVRDPETRTWATALAGGRVLPTVRMTSIVEHVLHELGQLRKKLFERVGLLEKAHIPAADRGRGDLRAASSCRKENRYLRPDHPDLLEYRHPIHVRQRDVKENSI